MAWMALKRATARFSSSCRLNISMVASCIGSIWRCGAGMLRFVSLGRSVVFGGALGFAIVLAYSNAWAKIEKMNCYTTTRSFIKKYCQTWHATCKPLWTKDAKHVICGFNNRSCFRNEILLPFSWELCPCCPLGPWPTERESYLCSCSVRGSHLNTASVV